MTSSGIITRGYGFARSTIITRGYGRIVDVVEGAIDLIPGVRRRPGGSRASRRPPPIDWKPPEKKLKKPEEQFEEICVSVELMKVHGVSLTKTIKGEVCRKFNNAGIDVDVTDVSVRQVDGGTVVEVKMIQVVSTGGPEFHVSASVVNT